MEDLVSRSTGSLIMSEDDRRLRQRSPGIRSVSRTFAIVTATAAATVLCILLLGRSTVSADPNLTDKQPETSLGIDNVRSTVSDSVTEQRPSVDHTMVDVERVSVNRNFPKEADPVDQDDKLRAQGLSTSNTNRIPIRSVPDRRTSHRLGTVSRQGDWNVAADKWSTGQDGWTVYQDVYDSGGSNAGDYGGGYQQSGNPQVDGIELTTEPINYPSPYGWWPLSRPVAIADQNRAPATVATVPATAPATADPGADPKTTGGANQNATAVDWRALGVVALVKFSLFALKTFAVVNSVMLLLFKAALAFLKFQLLVKSVKFVGAAAVSLPLLVTTTLFSPMLVSSLLSFPARALQLLTTPATPGGEPAPSPPTGQPNRPPGAVPSDRLGQFSLPTLGHQFDFTGSPYGRRHDSKPQPYGPAEMVFRKLMDSEKCVERIACRMALAERVGIMPFWMRWIVNGVSKVIPNEKLESYLKTYDDVNNTINTNVSTSGNWATWCLEHYSCSDTNLTNVKITKK